MPVIFGNVTDVARIPNEGVLEIRSPKFRPGGVAVITEDPRAYPIVDGRFETDNLEPGEVKFYLRGVRYREDFDLVVPDTEDPVDFLDLLDNAYEYPEEVVGQAQQAARAARASATEAENSAQRAEDLYGDLDAVRQARDAAQASATSSATSATESADSAQASAASATESATDAQAAAGSATAAADSAGIATGAADDASESAAFSKAEADRSHAAANTSREYNDTAWTASQDALAAKNDAVQAKTDAEAARDTAQGHAASAADSCSAAQDAATNAADDVRDELNGLRTDAQASATAAAESATDADASAEQARLSAESAAEVVSTGVPDATTSVKGKIQLAGDLSGSADAPTVPGLAQRAPLEHTHSIGQVDGLQPVVEDVDQATYQATPGRIARRGSDGTLSVAMPTGSQHAATKGYTDQVVASSVTDRPTKTYVDSRPALFSGAGAAPATIPGAVVGDWWLNTTTMELSKITGV